MTVAPLDGPALPDAARTRAAGIRLAVFDVDGVLTDGRVILGDDGAEYKAFHTHDGHGLRMLAAAGLELAVITGRTSSLVARRMEELRIRHVLQGRRDKAAALAELLDRLGVPAAETAYVGDDDVDVPALRRAGLAVAVADASPLARAHAHWVTAAAGGAGAAREVAEGLLATQDRLAAVRAQWLE